MVFNKFLVLLGIWREKKLLNLDMYLILNTLGIQRQIKLDNAVWLFSFMELYPNPGTQEDKLPYGINSIYDSITFV